MLRRTPCVGICSTTYGDLVCRGCKRFAHEIVQWNGFDEAQRSTVWQRLLSMRAGAVNSVLEVTHEEKLRDSARQLGLASGDTLDAANLLYELLQRLQWRERRLTLAQLGVRVPDDAADTSAAAGELLARIDQEFYRRSVAQYERNYRIPAE